jgi:hypothetical protein
VAALVNRVMEPSSLIQGAGFVDCVTISFSRRILPHGVSYSISQRPVENVKLSVRRQHQAEA